MAQELIDKGGDLYQKNQPKKAIEFLKKATEIDPNSTEAWLIMGLCYSQLQKNKYAVKCFEKALKIDPNKSQAWYFMGVEYMAANKYEEALECFDAMLAIDPNDTLAWFQQGMTYILMKKLRRAAQSLEKSVKIRPLSHSLRILGSVYKDLGEMEKAKHCFQQLYEMASSEQEKQRVKKMVKKKYGIKL